MKTHDLLKTGAMEKIKQEPNKIMRYGDTSCSDHHEEVDAPFDVALCTLFSL